MSQNQSAQKSEKTCTERSTAGYGPVIKNMKVGCKTSESVSYLSMRTAVKSADVEFRKNSINCKNELVFHMRLLAGFFSMVTTTCS